MSESEAWKALIATAMRRNVVVAVGEHRAAVEQEARAAFLEANDQLAQQLREAEAALRAIAAYEPDYSELPEVPSHEGCPECAKWVGHPVQRGLCDEGYRQLGRRDRARASLDSAQHFHMRNIARDALVTHALHAGEETKP